MHMTKAGYIKVAEGLVAKAEMEDGDTERRAGREADTERRASREADTYL